MNSRDLKRALKSGRRNFRFERFENVRLKDLELVNCDFSETTFRRATLDHLTLTNCSFHSAQFHHGSLQWSSASRTTFDSAYFVDSELTDLQFRNCSMEGTTLDSCRLRYSRLWNTNLEYLMAHATEIRSTEFWKCNVAHARLRNLAFIDSAIEDFCDAADLEVEDSSTIDWASVCHSIRSPALLSFLIATGMPEIFATYTVDCAKALDPGILMKLMRSTFISYGGPDAGVARRLQSALQRNGVRTFFFEKDAIPGMKLHEVMREGVNSHDRVVLICSHASLDRPGVLKEIEQTLAREARDGGASYLIPITIDDYIFRWAPERASLAQEIRDRVVADFRGSEDDDRVFADALSRLLVALRTDS